jgi:hypothetical protein
MSAQKDFRLGNNPFSCDAAAPADSGIFVSLGKASGMTPFAFPLNLNSPLLVGTKWRSRLSGQRGMNSNKV